MVVSEKAIKKKKKKDNYSMQKQKKELVARHIPRYVSKRKTVSRYKQYVLISFNVNQP